MEQAQPLAFGPFHFDLTTERLQRGARAITLRARARAVLRYLLAHPGRVIPREEFAQHVWAGTHVSKTALRVCIWEIRQALGDQTTTPQYIETVGQQGYRFVAALRAWPEASPPAVPPAARHPTSTSPFVGRQTELAGVQACLAQAQRGQPQLVLVTGDAGVGKTALVQQFLAHVQASGPCWVGQGQCIEHAGPGEAYLPLLDALCRVGRAPDGAQLLAALRRAAPTWLVHLPLLLETHERDTVQRQGHGTPREGMLRELVEALSLLTAAHVLILVLEDLQWSDASTVAWLAYVARRTDRLRLLVLGTYRPAEVIAGGHPLRQTVQELVAHRLCQELRLELLTAAEVQAYVVRRLGTGPATAQVGELLHRRTEGNALFMVEMLDHLLSHALLGQDGGPWRLRRDVTTLDEVLPTSLRALIEKQVEGCTPEGQACLAVASVAGVLFTVAEVAAGLQQPVDAIEDVCDGLCQQGQFLTAQGGVEWPDGTVTVQYGFRHALYHAAVYARIGPGQRARFHRRLAERLEAAYRPHTRGLASTLALHFERGRDVWQALRYRWLAAEQALQRSAYPEAFAHCQQGFAVIETLRETPERQRRELALRTCLSTVLTGMDGYASPGLEQNLQRAQILCQQIQMTEELAPVLVVLTRLSMVRADRQATEAWMAQERHLLERLHDAASLVQVHTQLGTAEMCRGAHARAQEHQTHALRLYDPAVHQSLDLTFSGDPRSVALAMSAWRLWLTGWPVQAADAAEQALGHAEARKHPLTLVVILLHAAHVRQVRGELDAAWALAQRLLALARAQDLGMYKALGMIAQGWVVIQRGELVSGLAQLTTGLAQYQACGVQLYVPFCLAFLAEAHLRCGQVEAGVRVIEEALRLTATQFDRFWEAELYRLRGELLRAHAGPPPMTPDRGAADVAACFQRALDIARQQGAKALELRAAMSLARLWQQQGKGAEAYALLAPLYGWFTEGFDTADLQEAKALLTASA